MAENEKPFHLQPVPPRSRVQKQLPQVYKAATDPQKQQMSSSMEDVQRDSAQAQQEAAQQSRAAAIQQDIYQRQSIFPQAGRRNYEEREKLSDSQVEINNLRISYQQLEENLHYLREAFCQTQSLYEQAQTHLRIKDHTLELLAECLKAQHLQDGTEVDIISMALRIENLTLETTDLHHALEESQTAARSQDASRVSEHKAMQQGWNEQIRKERAQWQAAINSRDQCIARHKSSSRYMPQSVENWRGKA